MRDEIACIGEIEEAILKTLTYADLFEHPLTLEELHENLMTPEPVGLDALSRALNTGSVLPTMVARAGGYYWLRGREKRVQMRRLRQAKGALLLERAALFVAVFSNLPWVEAVYLSGGSASGAPSDQDVDLFIVSKPGLVWTTFLSAWILKRMLRVRELVCANYVIDRERLALSEHDLFTAHQLLMLRCPFTASAAGPPRAANPWIREFFANAALKTAPDSHPATFLESLTKVLMAPAERIIEGLFTMKWTCEGRLPNPGVSLEPWRVKAHFVDHLADTMARFDRAWRLQLEQAILMGRFATL